jgi:hypothetical protein
MAAHHNLQYKYRVSPLCLLVASLEEPDRRVKNNHNRHFLGCLSSVQYLKVSEATTILNRIPLDFDSNLAVYRINLRIRHFIINLSHAVHIQNNS